MPEKKNINAAYRLHTLLKAASAQPQEKLQFQVWASVFHVENLSGRQQKQAVAKGIDLMFGQLDRVVEQLRALQHPEDSYRELVASIDQNITFEMLNHPWQDYRVRLATTLYPLIILSNTLPDEEKLVDPVEFQTIRGELDKLEQSLADQELSPEVRGFVKRQIDTIRRAMWEYQFRGVQAFQDAMLEGARDAYVSSDVVEGNKNDPHVQQVGQLWMTVKKIIDATIKVGGVLTAGNRIYQLVESGLHMAHHIK